MENVHINFSNNIESGITVHLYRGNRVVAFLFFRIKSRYVTIRTYILDFLEKRWILISFVIVLKVMVRQKSSSKNYPRMIIRRIRYILVVLTRFLQEIPRRLTPRECARLQGFPDTFKIVVSDTQAYKQFGNSVVVPLMTAVAEIVVKKVEELDNRKTSSGQNGEERAS